MNRLSLLAAGVAGAATLLVAPVAASAATTTATTTTTCTYGLQSGLATKVCADVTGTSVALYGTISLAGPPTPGTELPTKQLYTALSGQVVGGASLGTVNQNVLFKATTTTVSGVGGTVACGSTVRGTFSVDSYPWPSNPVAVEVTIPC